MTSLVRVNMENLKRNEIQNLGQNQSPNQSNETQSTAATNETLSITVGATLVAPSFWSNSNSADDQSSKTPSPEDKTNGSNQANPEEAKMNPTNLQEEQKVSQNNTENNQIALEEKKNSE